MVCSTITSSELHARGQHRQALNYHGGSHWHFPFQFAQDLHKAPLTTQAVSVARSRPTKSKPIFTGRLSNQTFNPDLAVFVSHSPQSLHHYSSLSTVVLPSYSHGLPAVNLRGIQRTCACSRPTYLPHPSRQSHLHPPPRRLRAPSPPAAGALPAAAPWRTACVHPHLQALHGKLHAQLAVLSASYPPQRTCKPQCTHGTLAHS